jgi:hypothetical protein
LRGRSATASVPAPTARVAHFILIDIDVSHLRRECPDAIETLHDMLNDAEKMACFAVAVVKPVKQNVGSSSVG